MFFDQITLLTAIGLSSAALSLTLLLTWLGSRSETFLVSWAVGMAFVVAGVVLFVSLGNDFSSSRLFAAFALLVVGFGFVYAGARQFRFGQSNWVTIASIVAIWLAAMAASFLLGYSGVGAALANLLIALLLILSGRQYWIARVEAPLPLIVNTALYAVTAASFALCGLVLLRHGEFVLHGRPENWAEDVNAFVVVIAVTGIGAMSLALSQTRSARRHQQEARTDPLTGLLNRRYLFEQFGGLPVNPATAVVVFDLDHFKSINDRYGHAAGDHVLRTFAALVKDVVGDSDAAFRLGGEEFCIILLGTTSADAIHTADTIRSRLESEAIQFENNSIHVTVSAGMTMCLGEPEALDTLISRADNALYRAKRKGRNRLESIGTRLVA